MKNFLRNILFSDVGTLIRLGRTRPLSAGDMPELEPHLRASVVEKNYVGLPTAKPFAFVWHSYWAAGFSARRGFIIDCVRVPLALCGPLLMRILLQHIALLQSNPSIFNTTLMLAVLLAIVVITDAVTVQHFYYNALLTWGRITNGLSMRVFKHSLALRRSAQLTTQTGDLVNHMANDTEGIAEASFFVPEIMSSLLLVVGSLIMLFFLMGPAALASVLSMILMIPITTLAARRFEKHDSDLWKHRDERVTLMSQILNGIRVVKYFAWERSVRNEVSAVRGKEVDAYVRLVKAESLGVMFFLSTTTVVAFVGFSTYVMLGGQLSAALVFPCLLLFMQLENPIGSLPHFIKNLAHARVAAERLHTFFQLETLEADIRPESEANRAVGVRLQNCSVEYTRSEIKAEASTDASAKSESTAEAQVVSALKDINLTIAPGESIAIVGEVGAGKSSLLSAILGEVELQSGSIVFDNIGPTQQARRAFVSQEAFILNASVLENILFGIDVQASSNESSSAQRREVEQALYLCGLDRDMEQLSAGVDTEIGERGVNLSGGQKMRVSLARAVMKQPGLVLLDDPLAAVDVHTEELLADRLIFGAWSGVTRIVTTHRLAHLNRFDRIVFLHDHRIEAIGNLEELSARSKHFKSFIAEHAAAEEMASTLTLQNTVAQKVEAPSGDGRFMDDEDRMTGSIKSELFFSYLKTIGRAKGSSPALAYIALVSSCLVVVALPIAQNSWLAWWNDALLHGKSMWSWLVDPFHALIVYGLIGILVLLANYAERLIWMLRATMAGRIIHDNTLESVLAAPLRFFDTTPMGRILNRFSHDMAGVDDELSWNFESTFRSLAQMLGTLVLILAVVPVVLFAAVPALVIFYRIQRDYRRCAREAKRLASISRSPRYAHYKETISGLGVIRAYGRQQEFNDHFVQKLENFQRMNWGSILLNRWFSSRAPILSGLIALTTTVTIVILCAKGSLAAGTAGVIITYSLNFWAFLNWTVRSFSEVESRMTSYERLRSYGSLLPEQRVTRLPELSKSVVWPTKGKVEFRKVQARYADDLPLVLRDLSFTIEGGMRVGIVGRTGSGKSTIFQSLFRFVQPLSGSILIDGVDIACIPADRLRRSLAVIPQDPMLFIGTVRSNLDRYSEYDDAAVWSALRRVHLADVIESLGGLEARISESGQNFSQGQRQLLCLARAILTRAKIIVMDEATASVDVKTDALIQQSIHEEFAGITMLIIAHRLNSVADADMIIELIHGTAHVHSQLSEVEDEEIG